MPPSISTEGLQERGSHDIKVALPDVLLHLPLALVYCALCLRILGVERYIIPGPKDGAWLLTDNYMNSFEGRQENNDRLRSVCGSHKCG